MPVCFPLISYLSFGTEIGKCNQQSLQRCKFLTDSKLRTGLSIKFVGYIVFAGEGHQRIIEVMVLIKIIAESVKFIGSIGLFNRAYKINMSLHTWINRFTLHNNSDNISFCLFWSGNSLNSKSKFKTILVNKSQPLLKALYLEDSLTLWWFLSAIWSFMVHIPNTAKDNNYLKEKANHTLCLKSEIKSIC